MLPRLAGATRQGGALALSLKEGDGEGWSTHGHVQAPRRFVYWREEPLRGVLESAGWRIDEVARDVGETGQPWLTIRASCNSERVRHTEFWSRMEEALGPAYYRAWAEQIVMAELGGRTAREALDAGVPAQAGVGRGLAGARAARQREMSVADVAVIGGTGFYSFLHGRRGAPGHHAVRRPVGTGRRRDGRRTPGGVPAAARRAPRVPAARDQLPRQPVGAALARRAAGAGAVRGRRTQRRRRARRPRGAGPAGRPHQRPGLVVRRGGPSTCRSPTPIAPGSRAALVAADPTSGAAARWSWSRDRGSPPAPSRSTTPRRAGP